MSRPFTGWHMLAMMVAFFGTVMAVNFTMARIAVGSFGGVVVENSYVASQHFNEWLAESRGQEALGWQVEKSLMPDRHLALNISGAPDGLEASAVLRPPLGKVEFVPMAFARTGPGQYVSTEPVAAGRWIVRLELIAGEATWRSETEVQ
jgi:nitrogen fixation protein FixH